MILMNLKSSECLNYQTNITTPLENNKQSKKVLLTNEKTG